MDHRMAHRDNATNPATNGAAAAARAVATPQPDRRMMGMHVGERSAAGFRLPTPTAAARSAGSVRPGGAPDAFFSAFMVWLLGGWWCKRKKSENRRSHHKPPNNHTIKAEKSASVAPPAGPIRLS